MQTTRLADGTAVVAPDGSQIHELVAVPRRYLSTLMRCASLSPT